MVKRLGKKKLDFKLVVLVIVAIGSHLITNIIYIPKISITNVELVLPELEYDYSCYTPAMTVAANNNTIVYLILPYYDMHSETIYSYIHKLCSCNRGKDDIWTLNTAASTPHFYIGPKLYVNTGFRRVLAEFNNTSCGPIFIDKPPVEPHLTIFTTTYCDHLLDEQNSISNGYYKKFGSKVNDTKYIFICHDNCPHAEWAPNVYFLTPRHNRYIVPSFFPPTIVGRSKRRKNKSPPLVFLVLGDFMDGGKRNINSLKKAIGASRDYNFTVRFLGGDKRNSTRSENLLRKVFPSDYDKIDLIPGPVDTYDFMEHVSGVDVVLPLVDKAIFNSKYQGGKKLTSSVSWGLGFHKKMILYRPLAELFGIQQDKFYYWLHNESETFDLAFRACLENNLNPNNGVFLV